MNNILDYGAIGDGITVNTEAIQRAIDAGGTVYIPAGTFVTGTLHLKSHGGLFLDAGAILKASHNHNDYNAVDYCPQNSDFPQESMAGTHLISAVEQEDVFITGYGTVDGDSHYWVNEQYMEDYCNFYAHPPIENHRLGQLVYFVECQRVRVQGVEISHAPFWHLFFHGCENVQVSNLRIFGEHKQWVNDGIDIDCCRNVTVTNCIIDTGDDAITLRGNGARLQHNDGVCENVVISNCVLTSYLDYGIRIGVGNGIVRNCLFSNITIDNTLNGIGITCRYSPHPRNGISVENVRFQNISIRAHSAFELMASNVQTYPPFERPIYIKNVSFQGVYAYYDRPACLLGFEGANIENIRFSDMDLHLFSEDPQNDRYPCNWSGAKDKRTAFYVQDVQNVTFDRIQVFCTEDTADIDPILIHPTAAVTVSNITKNVESFL